MQWSDNSKSVTGQHLQFLQCLWLWFWHAAKANCSAGHSDTAALYQQYSGKLKIVRWPLGIKIYCDLCNSKKPILNWEPNQIQNFCHARQELLDRHLRRSMLVLVNKGTWHHQAWASWNDKGHSNYHSTRNLVESSTKKFQRFWFYDSFTTYSHAKPGIRLWVIKV